MDVLYRYELRVTNWSDGFRLLKIVCDEHRVQRKTPKGCYINLRGLPVDVPWSKKWDKFILDYTPNCRKRWAYPTKELALDSFKHRKNMQLSILEYQIDNCKLAIQMIEEEAMEKKVYRPSKNGSEDY